MNNMVPAIPANEARVNITWQGQNGDLVDPVVYDSTDASIRQWVTEAVRTGGVPGIRPDANANFADFVVERFPLTDDRPFNVIQVRPKTPFGCPCTNPEGKECSHPAGDGHSGHCIWA